MFPSHDRSECFPVTIGSRFPVTIAYGWTFVDSRAPGERAGHLIETRVGNEASAKKYDRALLGNIYLSAPESVDIATYYLGSRSDEAHKYTEDLDSLMQEDDQKRLLIMRSHFMHHISVREFSSKKLGDFISNEIILLFSSCGEEDVHRRLQLSAIGKIESVKELLNLSGYKHRLTVFLIDTSGHYTICPGYNLTNLTRFQLPPSGCFGIIRMYDNYVKYFVGYQSYRLDDEETTICNWPNIGTLQSGDKSSDLVGAIPLDVNINVDDAIQVYEYTRWLSTGTLDSFEFNGTWIVTGKQNTSNIKNRFLCA